jgi:hypothetical protein
MIVSQFVSGERVRVRVRVAASSRAGHLGTRLYVSDMLIVLAGS